MSVRLPASRMHGINMKVRDGEALQQAGTQTAAPAQRPRMHLLSSALSKCPLRCRVVCSSIALLPNACRAGGLHHQRWLFPPPACPIAPFRPPSRLVCRLTEWFYPGLQDSTLSRVACRQLGFPLGIAVYHGGITDGNNSPSLPTWSDRALNCSGTELTVKMCTVQAARSMCDLWVPTYGSESMLPRLGILCYAGECGRRRDGWDSGADRASATGRPLPSCGQPV